MKNAAVMVFNAVPEIVCLRAKLFNIYDQVAYNIQRTGQEITKYGFDRQITLKHSLIKTLISQLAFFDKVASFKSPRFFNIFPYLLW